MKSLIRFGYQYIAKPILFQQDPERVHNRGLRLGSFLGKYSITRAIIKGSVSYENKALHQTVHGVEYKNPIGLSAGFDKDGHLPNIIGDVGFGFEQIGTITALPYKGNPKPRTLRLKKSKALIVNFGLKNEGIEKILKRLKKTNPSVPLSLSVGKSNNKSAVTHEAGIADYIKGLRMCQESGIGEMITINISCPNVFGGEPFTTQSTLKDLLQEVDKLKFSQPVYLKMPINLGWEKFEKLLDTILEHNIAGIIIGNLNKDRKDPDIKDYIANHVKGNVSGVPTKRLSNDLIKKTYKYCGDKLTIIGVGGVFSAKDAYEKITYGATLVQLITGMVYEGPQLIGEINEGVTKLLKKDGFKNVKEAVGSYYKDR